MGNIYQTKSKYIAWLIIFTVLMTSIIQSPLFSYADEDMVLSEESYYHLDMGVQVAYDGTLKEYGLDYGEELRNITANISGFRVDLDKFDVVDVYPLERREGSAYFPFDTAYASTNIPDNLGSSESYAYNQKIKDYVSDDMTLQSFSPRGQTTGHNISFTYDVHLKSSKTYDVIKIYIDGGKGAAGRAKVYELFGGQDKVRPEVSAAIEDVLIKVDDGVVFGENDRLYLIFCPMVIEYKIYEPKVVGELRAAIDAPAAVKTGEEFTVKDASDIDESLTVTEATLEKSIDGGAYSTVATWPGKGTAGENTGGTITQSSIDVCSLTYKLTVHSEDGQTATATKVVTVNDGREINATANLVLPEYTYEGHPTEASDESTFEVDGKSYSAKRAYEEKVASNRFQIVPSGDGRVSRLDKITAEMIWYEEGTRTGKLTINPANGSPLTDTENIEVRKTPYIVDNLGGFQKQNRKQILSLSVATYPDKPIVDWNITLKDIVTGNILTFNQSNLQQNNATIKTRTMSVDGSDKYWTNFELEFLTKTPSYEATGLASQNFQYSVFVKDSKGDTDTVTKTFTVKPDLPPQAQISLQNTFLRESGTNTAKIEVSDISTTDGDQLDRTWYTANRNPLNSTQSMGFNPVISQPGYKDNSFGTKQDIQFNKDGVGQFDMKLQVKDVWIEETLEEYVTEADYLTADAIVTSKVENIAPVVSIEPVFYEKADIVLLADKNNIDVVKNNVNSLKKSFLEKGIDADIDVVRTATANNNGFKCWGSKAFHTTVNCGACQANNNGPMQDSDFKYMVESANIEVVNGYEECLGNHIIHAYTPDFESGNGIREVWSYVVTESSRFSIQVDSADKYLYIICYDIGKTILLNRNNGAYVTTLNVLLPNAIGYMSSDGERMYYPGGNISCFDFNTLSLRNTGIGGSCCQLIEGKLCFVGRESQYRFYIGKFNMEDETVERFALPEIPKVEWTAASLSGEQSRSDISARDMDSKGRVVFAETYSNEYGDVLSYTFWSCDYESQTINKLTGSSDEVKNLSIGYIKDELGEAKAFYREVGTDSGTQATVRKYQGLFYHSLDENGLVKEGKSIYSKKTNLGNWNGVGYAKYNTTDEKMYVFMGNIFSYNLDFGDRGGGIFYSFDKNGNPLLSGASNFGFDFADEAFYSNQHLISSHMWGESWIGAGARTKLFTNSITEELAKKQAVKTYVSNDGKDTDVLKFIGEETPFNKESIIAETELALETKKSIKVTVDGEKGTLSGKMKLHPGKNYYVEYCVKPITENAGDITIEPKYNLKTLNQEASLSNDKYIVSSEEYEDFGDANINKFFTFDSLSKITGNYYLVANLNSGKTSKNAYHSGTGSFSFTVPEGKKAILSFYYSYKEEGYGNLGVPTQAKCTIDGKLWNRTNMQISKSEYYTHPVILESGTHTVVGSMTSYGKRPIQTYMFFDDIKVSFVDNSNVENTCLKNENGESQEYIVSNAGEYELCLHGPSSSTCGGIVKSTVTLHKGDVIRTYLGPQMPKATAISGTNGNGYGDSGNYKSELYLNGVLIMVAGGAGANEGTSWANSFICSNISYKHDSFGQAKAYITYIKNNGSPQYSNGSLALVSMNENKWTKGSAKIQTPFSSLEYAAMKYDLAEVKTGKISPILSNNAVNEQPAFIANIPQDKFAFFSNVLASMSVGGNHSSTYFTFEGVQYTYSKKNLSLPSLYDFHLLNSVGNKVFNGRSRSGRNSSFPSGQFRIIDAASTNSAIINGEYIINDDTETAYYLNGKYEGDGTFVLNFNNISAGIGEWLISGLRVYYIENGQKVYLSGTANALDDFSMWTKSSNVTVEGYIAPKEDEEEDTPIVYKKGDLVGYNINYSDYENDPANAPKSYWLYAHTPFNDGEHDKAAIVYDEDGNISKICGMSVTAAALAAGLTIADGESISIEDAVATAVSVGGFTLSTSIPRFYVDGKYTVYHWVYDDTSRETVAGGYPLWDKSSNIAELTFYIEGGASAPWVTSIVTVPGKVAEHNNFNLKIGVDDAEKDILSLTTEVYKDKKLIYTHRQRNIVVNESTGAYPYINTGVLTDAQTGVYEVVCTVRDATGAGLGKYKFIVVSLGKIEGMVNHTEAWNANRKKFNLSYFGNEVNRDYTFATYNALTDRPRPRGTNVFWSGEKFMLSADVAGTPTSVTCQIKDYIYSCNMVNSGKKNAYGDWIYTGSISHNSMINKWGNDAPEKLTFVFTANYPGGTTKTHEADIIIDNMIPYWRMHRVY